jgi:hypothetical protein
MLIDMVSEVTANDMRQSGAVLRRGWVVEIESKVSKSKHRSILEQLF